MWVERNSGEKYSITLSRTNLLSIDVARNNKSELIQGQSWYFSIYGLQFAAYDLKIDPIYKQQTILPSSSQGNQLSLN